MPVIRRSLDPGRVRSFDEPFSSPSSNTQFSEGSNIRKELSSSQTESHGRGSAERRFCISPAPEIVDFAVELDNANYKPEEPICLSPSPDFSFKFTLASSSYVEGEAPLHACLFENEGFESYGSSFYTQFIQENPAWTPANLTYELLSPMQPQVDGDIEDLCDRDAAACDGDSAEPHYDPSARMATMRVSPSVTTYSPTSPLLYSSPPAFSYPSPRSIDERDITEVTKVEEDYQPERDSLVPSSFTRPNKRTARSLSASHTKKRRASAAPISCSSTSVVRFPCRIPGCKQVCKTPGDLKRHESILAHKPPSWECRRCHNKFTREDALKRHNRNLPNCSNAKTNPRGRFAAVKHRYPDVARKIETTWN